VSLRIDSDLEYELQFIKSSLNLDFSKAIREAVHLKYLEVKEGIERRTPAEILKASGFIGSFDGPAGLSEEFKKMNLKSLRKKHG